MYSKLIRKYKSPLSWTALSLSRIMHSLILIDGDDVDQTNVHGGQLYRTEDVGIKKVYAVTAICRQFGCTNSIMPVTEMYESSTGMTDICITGLDNMKARKEVFNSWLKHTSEKSPENLSECLFIDGRMSGELCEVFVIQGNNEDQIHEYQEKWLFDDSEVQELECTRKQTTFMGMYIGALITSLLTNWLTNNKLGMELREVPFHTKFYSLILDFKFDNAQILV